MSHKRKTSKDLVQKPNTIVLTLTRKFTSRVTRTTTTHPVPPLQPPQPSTNVDAQARREAALRQMGLRPAPSLSQQEAEMDRRIPVLPPSPVAESEADRIKKEWETKNKDVAEDIQRERLATFKFGGISSSPSSPVNKVFKSRHIPTPSSSSSCTGAENDNGSSSLDPSSYPLPPSPDALSFVSSCPKGDENTLTDSGARTPRPAPVTASSPEAPPSPVSTPVISLTPPVTQQDPEEPSSPISSWSIPEPATIASASNGAISGTSILTPSLSSDSCLSGCLSSSEPATPLTTTLDSLIPSSSNDDNIKPDSDANRLAFDAQLGFMLEGLFAVVEEPEQISVRGASMRDASAEPKAGSLIDEVGDEDCAKDEDKPISSVNEEPPDAATTESKPLPPPPPPPPQKRSVSASPERKKLTLSLNPFKRSNTTRAKATTPITPVDGVDHIENQKKSMTLLRSMRQTVVDTFSPNPSSSPISPTSDVSPVEVHKSVFETTAHPVVVSPLSKRLRLGDGGGGTVTSLALHTSQAHSHSRHSSSESGGKVSIKTSSSSASSGNARQAVSPTMHNAASIVAHASKIEDEEMRRMTELAFLS